MTSQEQIAQLRNSVSNYLDAYNEYTCCKITDRRAQHQRLRDAELCLDQEMRDAEIWCIVLAKHVIRRLGTGHLDLFTIDRVLHGPEIGTGS